MMSYQYAVIRQSGTAIELQITDSRTLDQLLDRLSNSIPGFGASASKLPGGDPYYWRFCGLGEDVEQAWAIIVDHFDSCGWMSLDDRSDTSQNPNRTMCFGLLEDRERRETGREPFSCMSLA
jgi:hypothetical protein